MDNELKVKLEKSNQEVTDLYTSLIVDDQVFKDTFLSGLNDESYISDEKKLDFINNVFSIGFEIIGMNEFKKVLKDQFGENTGTESILKNVTEVFLPVFYDFNIKQKIEELGANSNNTKENPLEESKLADSNHISHIDVLSEIENPTPSISTTASFQSQANSVKQTSPNTPSISQKNPSSRTSTTPLGSPSSTPSLHSSDPSVVPYTNPALHIASKLDQNLSTPSASVPKDIYVSKKPDPYHEPVEI